MVQHPCSGINEGGYKMIPKSTNRLIDQELKKATSASMIVGVVSRDTMEVESYLHDYYQGTDPENLIVEIGSTTKTFTGTLLAKLVTEEIISLDDSVCPYIPEYQSALIYNGKEVTFRHLATHTASLPKDDMKTIRQQMKQNASLKFNPFSEYDKEDFRQFFLQHRPKREFGTKWVYSNLGISLLGHILAKIVNSKYEEAIETHILKPFGMNDTYFSVPEDKRNRYVNTYSKKKQSIPPIEINGLSPAGGLRSTVRDMLTYLRFQMGVRDTSPTLANAMHLSHQGQGFKAMKGYESALTWMIDKPKGLTYPIIHHGGNTIGFHTYCGFIKELEIGVIAVSTVQISFPRIMKMLLKHDGLINTNVAYSIFQHHQKKSR